MKRDWPVYLTLLAVLLMLLAVPFINESKGEDPASQNTPRDSERKGCFRGTESLPDFAMFKTCAKYGTDENNPRANRLLAIKKKSVTLIEDVADRGIECSIIGTPKGRVLDYGSFEELLIRVQPTHIDYGACEPEWKRFVYDLEGRNEK